MSSLHERLGGAIFVIRKPLLRRTEYIGTVSGRYECREGGSVVHGRSGTAG